MIQYGSIRHSVQYCGGGCWRLSLARWVAAQGLARNMSLARCDIAHTSLAEESFHALSDTEEGTEGGRGIRRDLAARPFQPLMDSFELRLLAERTSPKTLALAVARPSCSALMLGVRFDPPP